MKAMIEITKHLLPHLPAGHVVGEEIEVEYQLEWEGGFGHDEGEAVVSLVEYIEGDEEIDLTGLVEIEINHEQEEELRIDAQSANDDHVYESWKERDL